MRQRALVAACALAMLGSAPAAGLAGAAPQHNRNLTIAATPDPVIGGQGVLIYGRLLGPGSAGQTVRLFHHVVDGRPGYSPVATTTTDSSGYYEFTRAARGVYANGYWRVRGPAGSHSRTVRERVIPLVSITASTAGTDTSHAIMFRGHVLPGHRFAQVFLQQQVGSGHDWRTLRKTTLGPGSNYFIAYRWLRPGVHDVRVASRGDARDRWATSDPVALTIDRAQRPGFTISSSEPIVSSGGSVTLSGRLDEAGTNTPEPNTILQLWGRTPHQRRFAVLADTATGSGGSYSFTRSELTTNTSYYIATMPLPHIRRRHTAPLRVGVRDSVSLQADSSSASSGRTVTFTGGALPGKAGQPVYLEMLGLDAEWHPVQRGVLGRGSTFRFSWTAGSPGTQSFRARITNDRTNVGSASLAVRVTVTATAAATLSAAS